MSSAGPKLPATIPEGKHGAPDGKDCQICFCEIDASTYCEYKTHEGTADPHPLVCCPLTLSAALS